VVATRETWDIVCRVVDNYGDVGIAWRLARQLAADPRRAVRLIVDGLQSLARIARSIDASIVRQSVDGIEIVAWSTIVDSSVQPADVVVELLGCGLPDAYLDAMEARRDNVLWIDYEHLSAESWVDAFHGLPSPHPTRPLVKHFFYPGFGPGTGGLLIEPNVEARRLAFVEDAHAITAFRHALGMATDPCTDDATTRHVSLFAYRDAPVAALFDTLADDPRGRWSVVVPAGVLDESIDGWFASHHVAGPCRSHGALSVTTIPFVDQDDYDRLLWSCDLNFVRGEDSFVRAQAAGRPFMWAPYRQADAIHLNKRSAFEDRYVAGLDAAAADAERAMSLAWNAPGHEVGQAVRTWLAVEPRLRDHAERWRATLAAGAPLVDRLAAFVADRQRSP